MSVTEPPVNPAAPTVAAPTAPTAPATEPVVPEAPPPASKAWLGWLAGFVVLALLVGVNAVLFVRVQDAEQQADDAVALAGGNQAQLQSQLDQINQKLAQLQADAQGTSDDVATLSSQVTALKKCVNNVIDGVAQAAQTGKPVAVTKC